MKNLDLLIQNLLGDQDMPLGLVLEMFHSLKWMGNQKIIIWNKSFRKIQKF